MAEERLFFDENRLVIVPELYQYVPHPEFEQHVQDDEIHIDEDFRRKVNKLVQYPEPDTLLLRSEMTDLRLGIFDNLEPLSETREISGIVLKVQQLKDYIVSRGYMKDTFLNQSGVRETDPSAAVDGIYNVKFKDMTLPQGCYVAVYGIRANGDIVWLSSTYREAEVLVDGVLCDFPRQMNFNGYESIVLFFTSKNMYKEKYFSPLGDLVSVNTPVAVQSGTPWVGCVKLDGAMVYDGSSPIFEFNVNPALDNIYIRQKQFNVADISQGGLDASTLYIPQLNGVQMGKMNQIINGGGYLDLTGDQIVKLRRLLEDEENAGVNSVSINAAQPIQSEDEIL